MLYHVKWNTSKTKEIYQASKNSEMLMEYLEECLLREQIIELIGEQPTPSRGYGVLVYYYKPRKRLLSAAPRRNHDYIHVVLFNSILTKEQLEGAKFDLGNYNRTPDIKIHTRDEVALLVELLKKNLQKI